MKTVVEINEVLYVSKCVLELGFPLTGVTAHWVCVNEVALLLEPTIHAIGA